MQSTSRRDTRRPSLATRMAIPYEAVIHEAAVRVKVAGRPASRAQLTRVAELSEAEHISVRVIPFGLDDFAGAGSAMVYVGGAVPRLGTVVRDAPHGTAFVDSEAQLDHFRALFRRVKGESLDPGQSRDLIHKLIKEL
ncbi:Scr1 family TA system antitoxin-like transcriptional regulator [Streptomyces avermitilis]|uniref:Scr1 family TA system antitoxin-like transcriptional regulator n=1 Tax=Streptomyces avermitilis TaxID=33903 RepID=UPI0037F559EC